MSADQSRYIALLVRLWQPGHDSEPTWHASVENPHTAERHYFANLEALFAFLVAQTTPRGARSEDPAAMIQIENVPSAR